MIHLLLQTSVFPCLPLGAPKLPGPPLCAGPTEAPPETHVVPLQEHQRPAAELLQQLLSALPEAQLSLPDLLAPHLAAAHGHVCQHGVHAAGLAL